MNKTTSLERNNLTIGNPIKKIIVFSIPVLLGLLFQQLYGIVDAIIVDRTLGQVCFSAIGITGPLLGLVLGFAQGLPAGFSIVTSQFFGAGEMEKVRKSIATSIILCALITVILTVISLLITRPLLKLLNTPDKYFEYAVSYISTIFYGIGASILYNMVAFILRALGDSKTPLYFLLVASVLNIGLDLLFIMVFDMEIAGAGWATVLSQLLAGIACLVYMFIKYPTVRLSKKDWKTSWAFCGKHLYIGVPMGFQFSVISLGLMIQQSAINSLGDDVVTAYSAATRIENLAVQPFCALGTAMATFSGQNYGAKQYDRLLQGVRQSLVIGVVTTVVVAAIIAMFGEEMTYWFISTATERQAQLCQQYLRYQVSFYLVLLAIYIYRNALQGMNYSSVTVVACVMELVMRGVAAFFLVKWLGFPGICLSNPVAWIGSDLALLPAYFIAAKKLKKNKAVTT